MHDYDRLVRRLGATILMTATFAISATGAFAQETSPQTAPAKVVITQPPTTSGETTETTVTTTTKPDGTTTTVVTTKTYKKDSADDSTNDGFRMLQPDEKGLKRRFAMSYGTYNAFEKEGASQTGISSKVDYFFYRTTRHEALFSADTSFTSLKGSGGLNADFFEYRWRFGDAGHAYTGVNLGIGLTSGLGSGDTGAASGATIGYEYPSRTFVEYRYTALSANRIGVHQLLIGNRF